MKMNNDFTKTFDGMMRDLFNDFPASFGKTMREDVLHFPPVNIVENPTDYEIHLSAPGFEKSDFNISLDQNVLSISTEKKEEKDESTKKMIRKEFSYRSFKRSFTLDENINPEHINAKYENGILTLTLPKKEEVKQATREISVQ